MNLANLGGSMTGGSTVVLTPAGLSAGGKASYTNPDHTRLEPRIVDFFVSQAKGQGSDPGVARSGLKISFASRTTEEGCCNPAAGSVIIDIGIRWPLSQPYTVVDSALDYLQSLVFSSAFVDGIAKGTLPTA
jgi:hypothetical protein